MISCAELLAELGNYLENDTTAEVRRQLEGHLARCQTCRVLYDSVRKTVQVLTDSGSFDLPEATAKLMAETIMVKIRDSARG